MVSGWFEAYEPGAWEQCCCHRNRSFRILSQVYAGPQNNMEKKDIDYYSLITF